uniref:Uncharacterized protein n=1 Tax=Physcomitrium patens TaxID=3218 RepID=A0A2K1ILW3_PHYPA|nr:hypothetical protein PHYPA_026583 [Physcomitrium patens]
MPSGQKKSDANNVRLIGAAFFSLSLMCYHIGVQAHLILADAVNQFSTLPSVTITGCRHGCVGVNRKSRLTSPVGLAGRGGYKGG